MSLTFGSLFAGIGGFDLGFERAGLKCKWQVEIDDYANRVLAKHWPNVHRERDICNVGRHNLERVDVICGGFPCQDISYAGLGAGLDGERSGLFFEAIRVVRELRPRVVVLENVAALLTRGLDRVLGTLAEIGFDAEWHCIPAAAVGAPHIRDRLFVIGRRDCSDSNSIWIRGQGCGAIKGEARRDETPCQERERVRFDTESVGQIMADTNDTRPQGMREKWAHPRREDSDGYAGQSSLGGRTGPQQWQAEPAVGRVADGIPARVDRLRGLGNAVVPQVAEIVGAAIVEALK